MARDRYVKVRNGVEEPMRPDEIKQADAEDEAWERDRARREAAEQVERFEAGTRRWERDVVLANDKASQSAKEKAAAIESAIEPLRAALQAKEITFHDVLAETENKKE